MQNIKLGRCSLRQQAHMLIFPCCNFILRERRADSPARFHSAIPAFAREVNFERILRVILQIKFFKIDVGNLYRVNHLPGTAPFRTVFQQQFFAFARNFVLLPAAKPCTEREYIRPA